MNEISKYFKIIKLSNLSKQSNYVNRMKCKLCVSPAELHTSESIEWFFNSSSNASIADVPIETSEHILVTPAERDLYLYSVQVTY